MAKLRNEQVALQRGNVSIQVNADGCISVFREYKGVKCRATVNIGAPIRLDRGGKTVLDREVQDKGDKVLLNTYGFLCEMM